MALDCLNLVLKPISFVVDLYEINLFNFVPYTILLLVVFSVYRFLLVPLIGTFGSDLAIKAGVKRQPTNRYQSYTRKRGG